MFYISVPHQKKKGI